MKKFENSKVGQEVYNSRIGKGTISRIEEHRIITVHNMRSYIWDLDGMGIIGQLHYFGKVKESD